MKSSAKSPRWPTWKRVLRTAISGSLLGAVLLALNLAAAGLAPAPWDVSSRGQNSLSPLTLETLKQLNGPLRVTIVAEPEIRTTPERTFQRTTVMLEDLLKQYQQRTDRFTFEQISAESLAARSRSSPRRKSITAGGTKGRGS